MPEVDGKQAEQCPVCNEVWGMEQDTRDQLWHFIEHTRSLWRDNQPLHGIWCPGSRCTIEQAAEENRQDDAGD